MEPRRGTGGPVTCHSSWVSAPTEPASRSSGVGEDTDDVGAPFDLRVHPREGVVGPALVPVRDRESANA